MATDTELKLQAGMKIKPWGTSHAERRFQGRELRVKSVTRDTIKFVCADVLWTVGINYFRNEILRYDYSYR